MPTKAPIRVLVLEDEGFDHRVFAAFSSSRYARRFEVVGRRSTDGQPDVHAGQVDLLALGLKRQGHEAVSKFRSLHVSSIPTMVVLPTADPTTGYKLMSAGAETWVAGLPLHPAAVVRAAELAASRGRIAAETRMQLETLSAYHKIAEVLSSPGSLKSNLRKVLRILVDVTGAGRGAIRFPDERQRYLVLYAAVGPLARLHPPQPRVPINDQSQGGRCFLRAETILENYHEPGGRSGRQGQSLPVKAGLHVPVIMDGQVKATIGLGAGGTGFFTPNKVALAAAVGRELGPLVAAAQLRESLTIERTLREHRDDFISVVSHELRTPMTMMMGFSELLLDGEPDAETRRSWYEMIYSQTHRLAGLIDQMLNVSDLQSGHIAVDLSTVDVLKVISEVIDECSRGYPLHKFSTSFPDGRIDVTADREMLRQVLRNLVDNAAKFSPEGGPVDVKVRDHGEKGLVEVSVEDEGIGVMPGDRERLFQTFSRGSNPEVRTIHGVGLGLYTSKNLSESMGCQITFSKRPGRGSRFTLDIPMAA